MIRQSASGAPKPRTAQAASLAPRVLLATGFVVLAACARAPQRAEPPAPRDTARRSDAARLPAGRPAFDRAAPPELGPPPMLSLAPVEARELANGLRLLIVEHHELPLADFILLVRSGGETDLKGKPGVASLAATMLDEGTTSRSALEIAGQSASLGAHLATSSDWDASTVSLHTPTAQLDSALALFADVVLHPAFRAADFERVREERLTELIQMQDHPPVIADRAYASIVYGTEHPYGRPLTGTQAAVQRITREDLRRFYRTYFRPNNAALIVVGDVTADDIERRAARLFGAWERALVPPAEFRDPPPAGPTAIYLIDKPGAPQSSVRIGAVGVPRSTEDFFAIQVMNTLLGGSFTSRLNQNLREAKGYTYGAFSQFDMRRAPGPFTAQAEVVAEKTDSALVEFLKELRAIRDTVPMAELSKAKRYLQLGLPAELETTDDIARRLVPIVLYDLPLEYYNTYVQAIERVSQADAKRAAERYIDPDRLAVVIVGDRSTIEASLRALEIGATSIRDFSGQPVRP
jgi:zinc protease